MLVRRCQRPARSIPPRGSTQLTTRLSTDQSSRRPIRRAPSDQDQRLSDLLGREPIQARGRLALPRLQPGRALLTDAPTDRNVHDPRQYLGKPMTPTATRSTPPALPTAPRLPIPTGPGYLGVPVHRALRNLHTLNVSTLSDIGHLFG